MSDTSSIHLTLRHLNALAGGLFLLTPFGLIAARQVLGSLKVFVVQSLMLAASAFLVGYEHALVHLFAVGVITVITKSLVIHWLLRRTLSEGFYARREASQALNIPTSLLIALSLAIFAYLIASPLSRAAPQVARINLPIGLAALLIGGYCVTVRREAIPQIIGILVMENGAFFAGLSIAPDLPLIAELAAAFDVFIVALVMGLLTRKIHERIGATAVGELSALKED